eukprot:7870584-Alexandrium_andersonii.AAC.1
MDEGEGISGLPDHPPLDRAVVHVRSAKRYVHGNTDEADDRNTGKRSRFGVLHAVGDHSAHPHQVVHHA